MPRQNLDTSADAKKKYSAAYFMGRELMLEPFERAFAVVPNR